MKQIITFIIVTIFPVYLFAQLNIQTLSHNQKEEIIAVSELWITELFKGEKIDVALDISTVPFALDKERVLTSTKELKDIYSQIIEDKGKREVPKLKITIIEHKQEIIENCIPIAIVKVNVFVDDDNPGNVLLCLTSINGKFKVCGFLD